MITCRLRKSEWRYLRTWHYAFTRGHNNVYYSKCLHALGRRLFKRRLLERVGPVYAGPEPHFVRTADGIPRMSELGLAAYLSHPINWGHISGPPNCH